MLFGMMTLFDFANHIPSIPGCMQQEKNPTKSRHYQSSNLYTEIVEFTSQTKQQSALKAKLTWIQSKRKAAANLQAGYYLDTKRNARKIKKSPWFLYAEEVPLCWALLNFWPRVQPKTLSSKASNEGMPSTRAFLYTKDFN